MNFWKAAVCDWEELIIVNFGGDPNRVTLRLELGLRCAAADLRCLRALVHKALKCCLTDNTAYSDSLNILTNSLSDSLLVPFHRPHSLVPPCRIWKSRMQAYYGRYVL